MLRSGDIPDIVKNIGMLDNRYEILYTIGQGRYAKVKLSVDKETGERVAIKIMKKSCMSEPSGFECFVNEVNLLSELSPHKHIVQLLRVSVDGKYTKADGRQANIVYYVMRIAENGELFKFLMYTPKFDEGLARFFFTQLISSLAYLHKEGIAHRDIKPENIVINSDMNLKLCDFGFAVSFRSAESQQDLQFDPLQLTGSPEYNPPELTQYCNEGIRYSAQPVDIFSSGCVLFMMVMSSAPFGSTKQSDRYYSRFCQDNKSSFWKIFSFLNKPSNEFQDLIHKILEVDPSKRLTLEQIKDHPWMNGPIPSIEVVREEMKERIRTVLDKSLEELRNKIDIKAASTKKKEKRIIDADWDGCYEMTLKYKDWAEGINKIIFSKKNTPAKKKSNLLTSSTAQPYSKNQSSPIPSQEDIIKQNTQDIKNNDISNSTNSLNTSSNNLCNQPNNQTQNIKKNHQGSCSSVVYPIVVFEEHKLQDYDDQRRQESQSIDNVAHESATATASNNNTMKNKNKKDDNLRAQKIEIP